jgi:hypothetical protein
MLGISEILDKIDAEPDYSKRMDMLGSNVRNIVLMKILELAYHPGVVWNLPEGNPPYKPCQFLDQQVMLYNTFRKMYLWIGEGNPNLSKAKREALFINFLEALDPADAKLILAVKEGRLPYENIDENLVRSVFPTFLPSKSSEETTVVTETDPKRSRGRPKKVTVNA